MPEDELTDQEALRYRDALENALGQLDWCIRYFHEIRRPRIADVIARNVRQIRRDLRNDQQQRR